MGNKKKTLYKNLGSKKKSESSRESKKDKNKLAGLKIEVLSIVVFMLAFFTYICVSKFEGLSASEQFIGLLGSGIRRLLELLLGDAAIIASYYLLLWSIHMGVIKEYWSTRMLGITILAFAILMGISIYQIPGGLDPLEAGIRGMGGGYLGGSIAYILIRLLGQVGMLIEMEDINKYPPEQLVIVTTGSQGEPMSALARMASADHPWVGIEPGDTVIISANPIPGNEKLVAKTVDLLYRQGAEVIYEKSMGVHVSGHASQEELKILINLARPRYVIPVHGEYRHLMKHAKLAESLGIPRSRIFVAENGQIIEIATKKGAITGKVTAGRVLVDGLGVGDVGNIVLRDRKQLSQDGIIIVVVTINKDTGNVVAGPDIVTRGFVYVRESEQLIDDAKERVKEALEICTKKHITEWSVIKTQIRERLSKQLFEKTGRKPMILPIIMEV
jgi:hypothetical protein